MTRVLATTLIAVIVAVATGSAQQPGNLVVVGWGGSYQQAQAKAFFEPFEAATGTKVTQDTGPKLERSKAEVESGRPSFDLTSTNQSDYLLGVQQNLWEPIDYSHFSPEDLKALPEGARLKFGVGTVYYAEVLAFNTQTFPDGGSQPKSWADFWDVKKFPGRRILPTCDRAGGPPIPEAALLADGVAPDQLYPIDIPRAIRKLKELVPHVVWYQDAAQAGQFLVNREGVMAMGGDGRFKTLIRNKAPLRVVWNQGRFTFDVWYVLRGAKNKDAAMRFIAFASRPQPQAQLAKLSGYGPVNPLAFQHLDEETARDLPTYPGNLRQMFLRDDGWWQKTRQQWFEACRAAVLG